MTASSLVVTDSGKDLTFAVDKDTRVLAKGAGTATQAAGGSIAFTKLVGVGDTVSVSYAGTGSTMRATEIRITVNADGPRAGGPLIDAHIERRGRIAVRSRRPRPPATIHMGGPRSITRFAPGRPGRVRCRMGGQKWRAASPPTMCLPRRWPRYLSVEFDGITETADELSQLFSNP